MHGMITCSVSTIVSSSSSSLLWASCRKERSSINTLLKQLECMQATIKCTNHYLCCLTFPFASFLFPVLYFLKANQVINMLILCIFLTSYLIIAGDIDKFKEKFQPLAYRLLKLVVLSLPQLPLLLQ